MLINQLQDAMRTSKLSTYRLARLSEIDLPQLCKFRSEGKGLSLLSASRVCYVLRLELKQRAS